MPAMVPDVTIADTLMKGNPPGPLSAGSRFTQSFTAEHDRLSAVEMEVSAYGRSITRGGFRLVLTEALDGPPLAIRDMPASAIPNCCVYVRLTFPPLTHSAGKRYFISLSQQGILPPDAITVFMSGTDVYPRGEFFIGGKATGQDTSFRSFYTPSGSFCGMCLSGDGL